MDDPVVLPVPPHWTGDPAPFRLSAVEHLWAGDRIHGLVATGAPDFLVYGAVEGPDGTFYPASEAAGWAHERS